MTSKDIDFNAVGNLIFQLREKLNINQQQLADCLHVSKAAICQWESGSGIKTEKLYDLAKYFNITDSELIEGRLNDDDEDEYFQRNYDLTSHPDFSVINDENIKDLRDYLQRCRNVINRFFKLFPYYLNHDLNKKQTDEFNRLLRIFSVDYNYLAYAKLNYDFLENLIDELKVIFDGIKPDQLDFELMKIFDLRIDVNPLSVIQYDETTARIYLDLLTVPQKDTLLTKCLNTIENDDIEKSLIVKRLLDNGAKCLYTYDRSDYYPLDFLEGFEGKVVENYPLNQIQKHFNNVMLDTKGADDYEIEVDSWKTLFKDEYKMLIDETRTADAYHVIYEKENKPLLYREYINKRDSGKLKEDKKGNN